MDGIDTNVQSLTNWALTVFSVGYVWFCVGIALVIRLVASLIKAFEQHKQKKAGDTGGSYSVPVRLEIKTSESQVNSNTPQIACTGNLEVILELDTPESRGQGIEDLSYWDRFLHIFRGFSPHNDLSDHLLGGVIGFAEISVFPVLILSNNLTAVGAWLALKTVVAYKSWQENARFYNRFLVQTIINVAAAFTISLFWSTSAVPLFVASIAAAFV